MTRRLWLLVMVLVGVAVPLGPAVVAAGVPGGGPDVVSTLWGMWWFQQAGAAMPLGGETTLVNHPFGAHGVVLSPSTAALWSVCEPWLGSGRSASLVVAAVLVALVAGVGMLARAAGVGPAGAAVAASALLVGRYLVFGAGEGSVVAIANVPLPLGLAALVWLARGRGGAGAAAALAACTVAVATENPYLAPVLPTVTAGVPGTRIGRTTRLERVDALSLGGALVGGVGVVLVAGLFGRAASPDYPREVAGTLLSLGTWDFTVVDLPWARVRPSEVLWGGPVRWTVDAAGGVAAGGGRTLGVTVLGMALIGGVRAPEARPWLALGAGCFVVSLGSQVGDLGTPFLYLNTVMAEVARPLTQPVRFLAVTQIAVAVAAGFGAEVLLARAGRSAGLAVGGAMLLECAFLGGGSLRMPVTALPEAACVEDLEPGAVLVWPWDARDGEPSVAQLLQLQHEQAAVHPGIASWRQLERSAIQRVRAMGVTDRGRSEEPLQLGRLDQHGYRWIIVDEGADPQGRARMRPQLGRPIAECPGFAVFDIRRPAMGPLD
ncbi:MAG: hypothetical protein VX000_15400 [Myxococcota bacterium]|nr:hypothetical protein [Myxococcota bacterium]